LIFRHIDQISLTFPVFFFPLFVLLNPIWGVKWIIQALKFHLKLTQLISQPILKHVKDFKEEENNVKNDFIDEFLHKCNSTGEKTSSFYGNEGGNQKNTQENKIIWSDFWSIFFFQNTI
jgi:hypothetical protein